MIPVATRNAVVKLDAKKAEGEDPPLAGNRRKCSQTVQTQLYPSGGTCDELKRSIFYIEEQKFDLRMIPYELEKGMDGTKTVLEALRRDSRLQCYRTGGGFDEEEIQLALKMGVKPVSLGKRILRTETAGPAILALLMMKLEGVILMEAYLTIQPQQRHWTLSGILW